MIVYMVERQETDHNKKSERKIFCTMLMLTLNVRGPSYLGLTR